MTEHEFKGYALVLKSGADPTTGGIAIAGFTTAGMVGVIAASHIIRTLRLNQLGTVLNADFPAVALIQDEIPKPLLDVWVFHLGLMQRLENPRLIQFPTDLISGFELCEKPQ